MLTETEPELVETRWKQLETSKYHLKWVSGVLNLPLLAVLLYQSIIALVSLNNTAFQDEALYIYAGRQLLSQWTGGPKVNDNYATYFSGHPDFYPVIAGVFDTFGGLELVRFSSLLCMLGVTSCVYAITKHLYNQNTALVAAALFCAEAPVLFLSRLATYDAICLFLLSFSTLQSLRVSTAKKPWGTAYIGVALACAITAKYAAMLFVPSVLAILVWQTLMKLGWKQTIMRLGLTVLFLVLTIGLILMVFGFDVLTGLSFTTTNRVAIIKDSPLELGMISLTLGGFMFGLALIGVVLSGWRRLVISLVLAGSGLLAPAYHIYKGELVSIQKHIAFSLIFAAPLAGYAVAQLCKFGQNGMGKRWLAGLTICLLMSSWGTQQAQYQYHVWANTDALVEALKTQVRLGNERILVQELEVPRYYLQEFTVSKQWYGLYFFDYTDKSGKYLQGQEAYTKAIQEGYFTLVVLHYDGNPLADYIDKIMKQTGQYELITKVPYQAEAGPGNYWIWRKK